MKKLLLFLALIIGQFSVKAQTIAIGGGIVYGTGLNQGGVNFRGQYYLTYPLSVSAELNYFFKDNASRNTGEVRTGRTEFAAIARYRFFYKEKFNFYPMLGLGWVVSREIQAGLNEKKINSVSEGALIAGAGAAFQPGRIGFFAEYRYLVSPLNQGEFVAGVYIKDFWGKF